MGVSAPVGGGCPTPAGTWLSFHVSQCRGPTGGAPGPQVTRVKHPWVPAHSRRSASVLGGLAGGPSCPAVPSLWRGVIVPRNLHRCPGWPHPRVQGSPPSSAQKEGRVVHTPPTPLAAEQPPMAVTWPPRTPRRDAVRWLHSGAGQAWRQGGARVPAGRRARPCK